MYFIRYKAGVDLKDRLHSRTSGPYDHRIDAVLAIEDTDRPELLEVVER